MSNAVAYVPNGAKRRSLTHLVFTKPPSSKQWSASLWTGAGDGGYYVSLAWGKINGPTQALILSYGTEWDAKVEIERRIKEKIAKGYTCERDEGPITFAVTSPKHASYASYAEGGVAKKGLPFLMMKPSTIKVLVKEPPAPVKVNLSGAELGQIIATMTELKKKGQLQKGAQEVLAKAMEKMAAPLDEMEYLWGKPSKKKSGGVWKNEFAYDYVGVDEGNDWGAMPDSYEVFVAAFLEQPSLMIYRIVCLGWTDRARRGAKPFELRYSIEKASGERTMSGFTEWHWTARDVMDHVARIENDLAKKGCSLMLRKGVAHPSVIPWLDKEQGARFVVDTSVATAVVKDAPAVAAPKRRIKF
jgi:predicted DNA-binding WGR domain protein